MFCLSKLKVNESFAFSPGFLKSIYHLDSCGRGLDMIGSGERFQNNAVSVTKFTCFVLTEGGFVLKKVCGFKNIRVHVK